MIQQESRLKVADNTDKKNSFVSRVMMAQQEDMLISVTLSLI